LLPATVDDDRNHDVPEVLVGRGLTGAAGGIGLFRVICVAGGVGCIDGLIEKLLQVGVTFSS